MDTSGGTDWLTILKFLGILVSGALGIIGTLTETHDEEIKPPKKGSNKPRTVRRLNKWGRWATALTILGFVAALSAQFAESMADKGKEIARQIAERNKDRKERENTQTLLQELHQQAEQSRRILTNLDQQGDLANRSLTGIERVITKFEDFSVWEITYELPQTNPIVVQMKRHLDWCIKDRKNLKGLKMVWPSGLFSAQPDEKGETNRFSGKVQRLLRSFPASSEYPAVEDFLESLTHSVPKISLNQKPKEPEPLSFRSDSMQSWYDYEPVAPNIHSNTFIHYALPSGRIFVQWQNIKFPQILKNGKITSIHDLDKVRCYLEMVNYAPDQSFDSVYFDMVPVSVDAYFDDYGVTLKAFKPVARDDGLWSISESTFPSTEEILRGQASKPGIWP